MKSKKHLYNDILKYDNALEMYNKIKRSCRNRKAVYEFSLNLNTHIMNILMLLKERNYKFSRYKIFMIRDPKFRIIMSENIPDKLVNHLVSKHILLPALESKLIDTNVATRIDKGSGYAFNMFVKYINKLKYTKKEIYLLKIDIKKYFYNIDHEILKELVRKYIRDKDALDLLDVIIDSTNEEYVNKVINNLKEDKIKYINNLNITDREKNIKLKMIRDIPLYQKGKGLPIGNMTSQILAIFYMNSVDHFIKENLGFKYYIRYMDDLLIIDTDLDKLKNSFDLIVDEIRKLKLDINSKSNIYKLSNGISFLGYMFKLNKNNKLIVRYNNKTIRRINKRLKNLYKYDYEKYVKSYGSYKGYLYLSNTKLYSDYLSDYYKFENACAKLDVNLK